MNTTLEKKTVDTECKSCALGDKSDKTECGQYDPKSTYVAYTFLDEQTAKDIGIRQYTLAPNFVCTVQSRRKLIRLALKRFFGIDVQDDTLPKAINHGCVDGIYFRATCGERFIGVAVSPIPIGVGCQVPFTTEGNEEHATRYFTQNEIEECRRRSFDDETIFTIYSKKAALRNRNPEHKFGPLPQPDTTNAAFTLLKEHCNRRDYYLTATDYAEFVKIDIHEVLPDKIYG